MASLPTGMTQLPNGNVVDAATGQTVFTAGGVPGAPPLDVFGPQPAGGQLMPSFNSGFNLGGAGSKINNLDVSGFSPISEGSNLSGLHPGTMSTAAMVLGVPDAAMQQLRGVGTPLHPGPNAITSVAGGVPGISGGGIPEVGGGIPTGITGGGIPPVPGLPTGGGGLASTGLDAAGGALGSKKGKKTVLQKEAEKQAMIKTDAMKIDLLDKKMAGIMSGARAGANLLFSSLIG